MDYYEQQTYDFKVRKGDTENLKFEVYDSNGDAVDLTDYDVEFNVKNHITDTIVSALQKTHDDTQTNGNGIYLYGDAQMPSGLTIDASNKMVVILSYFDTNTLGEGVFPFDIQLTDSRGAKVTPISGNIIVLREITQSVS